MVKLSINADTVPAKRKEFHQMLEVLVKESRLYKGCLVCDYTTDLKDNNRFTLTSHWATYNALDDYLASHLYKVLSGAIRVLCNQHNIDIAEKIVETDQG